MITRLFKTPIRKTIAIFLLITMVSQLFYPTAVWALTDGPKSPEFKDFEPVMSTDMVNTFTGDFSYNLPVLEVPGPYGSGYAMSLSYHQGMNQEEEASWVGFGWTLNPGAINRNIRGVPDDFNGEPTLTYNKLKPNISANLNYDIGVDVLGIVNTNTTIDGISYNNYGTMGKYWGFELGIGGIGSLGMNVTNGDPTFSLEISPEILYSAFVKKAAKQLIEQKIKQKYNRKISTSNFAHIGNLGMFGSEYGLFSRDFVNYPLSTNNQFGFTYRYNAVSDMASVSPVNVKSGYIGQISMSGSVPVIEKNAFGYLNESDFNGSKMQKDYFVEKGETYNRRLAFLGIPYSTYDIYQVMGEQVNGGFRAYRKQIGVYSPEYSKRYTALYNAGSGRPASYQFPLDVEISYSTSLLSGKSTVESGNWEHDAPQPTWGTPSTDVSFKFEGDLGHSNVYNPTELPTIEIAHAKITKDRTINFIPGLRRFKPVTDDFLTSVTKKIERNDLIPAKGSSNIEPVFFSSYTNDKRISGYKITNASGDLHEYLEPVMARNELEAAIKKGPLQSTVYTFFQPFYMDDQLRPTVYLNPPSNSTTNHNKEITGRYTAAEYASQYLLTSIKTSDYIDINNDGVGDEDYGGWTKFNYRKKWGTANDNNNTGTCSSCSADRWYRWRMPYYGFKASQGKMSDFRDDNGVFTTGEKEVKYLHSIETKTHVAFFVTNMSDYTDFVSKLTEINSNITNESYYTTIQKHLTGNKVKRIDGWSAPVPSGGEDPAASSSSAPVGEQDSEYLERIVLFAKSDLAQPLKSVNFKYDYSICPGILNGKKNVNTDVVGKLTLKRVWMEYNGINNAKISPYEFEYNANFPGGSVSGFTNLNPEYASIFQNTGVTTFNTNASYNPKNIDRWGNYMAPPLASNIPSRYDQKQFWLHQGKDETEYDSGTWQLKNITLPSGGTIIVHYETDDYKYVQDKEATTLVSLLPTSIDNYDPDQNKYYINVNDIKLNNSSPYSYDNDDVVHYKNILSSYFKDKYIYFKFLYAFKGSSAQISMYNFDSDYVDGYVKVNNIGLEEISGIQYIYFQLGEEGRPSTLGSFIYDNEEVKAVPKHACYDFLISEYGNGKVNPDYLGSQWAQYDMDYINDQAMDYYQDHAFYRMDDYTNGSTGYFLNNISKTPDGARYVDNDFGMAPFGKRDREYAGGQLKGRRKELRYFLKFLKTEMEINDFLTLNVTDAHSEYKRPKLKDVKNNISYCLDINEQLSYLKLPVVHSKKGGGLRVKRLMYYDAGIEAGDASVYGNEYIYRDQQGNSSGVATNEPQIGKEDNTLVTLIDRYEQTLFNRLVSGRYKLEFEGPIGEAFLPAPSVGYSRVTVKNINSKSSGGGYSVYEYHTVKDYPMSESYVYDTPNSEINNMKAIQKTDLNKNRKRDWLVIPNLSVSNTSPSGNGWQLGFSMSLKKEWAAQGYRFLVHNRHGKLKGIFNYAGQFIPGQGNNYLVSSEYHQYYEPGEPVKMMLPNGDYYEDIPGKQSDIAMEQKMVREKVNDLSMPVEIGVKIMLEELVIGPIINFSFGYHYSQKQLGVHTTSQVISYPAILKSVTKTQDGVMIKEENLAFDPYTGNPVLVKSNESFTNVNDLNTTDLGANDLHYYTMKLPASWYYNGMAQKSVDFYNTNKLDRPIATFVMHGTNPLDNSTKINLITPDIIDDNNDALPALTGMNVVNASIQTYKDFVIPNSPVDGSDVVLKNLYAANVTTKSQPHKSYVYKADRSYPVVAANTYKAGYYNGFTQYDISTTTNPNWKLVSEIIRYTPNGEPVEELDAMGIASAVRYNKQNGLVEMTGKNTDYGSMYFRSLETESGGNVVSNEAHSGKKSIQINNGSSATLVAATDFNVASLSDYPNVGKTGLTQEDEDLIMMMWVKGTTSATLTVNSNTLNRVGSSGEWSLYSGKIVITADNFAITLSNGTGSTLYVDDIRLQPFYSEGNCFVYDSFNRLITSFDGQHFGVFYEYNQEGKLIRKRIETERGFMTVKESQYGTPLKTK